VVALIVDVDGVEVVGAVGAGAVVEAGEEQKVVEATGRTLPRNERGKTRIRRVGGTIIGRGDTTRRWRGLGLGHLLNE
jgi:hypothetical protein